MIHSRRRLTMADLAPLSEEERDQLALVDVEDQEDLDLSEYELWQVTVAGGMHTVFHGFPGDNPLGVFVAPTGWIEFGEALAPDSTDETFIAFYRWYLATSQQMRDYAFLSPL